MKIFHAADLHYCPKHLQWADRAFGHAVDHATKDVCNLAVIAGDSFDASMGIHEPAVSAYLRQIARLADAMPVLVLQGTYSHDRPGSLDMLRELRTTHPVYVADEPGRIAVYETPTGLVFDAEHLDEDVTRDVERVLTICALPSLNKADPAVMEQGAAAWAQRLLTGWGIRNAADRELGIPAILVTHGTVVGSITESGYAMVSPDHEFTPQALLAAECEAVMLGHIHKHQTWRDRTPSGVVCSIAYPGSIARLVYGQMDPTGYLTWQVEPDESRCEFHEAPSRQLLEIAFDGPPAMDSLREYAANIGDGDHVRIRWNIDQEHAASVDKRRIRELFAAAGSLKLEGTVNPIQSVRAQGISRAVSLGDKIAYWAGTTGDAAAVPGLLDRLDMLRSMDVDQIVAQVSGDETAVKEAA